MHILATRYITLPVIGGVILLVTAVLFSTSTGGAQQPLGPEPEAREAFFDCMLDSGYSVDGGRWTLPDGSAFPPANHEVGVPLRVTDAMWDFRSQHDECARKSGLPSSSAQPSAQSTDDIDEFYDCMEGHGWERPQRLSGADEPRRFAVNAEVTRLPEWKNDRSRCFGEIQASE